MKQPRKHPAVKTAEQAIDAALAQVTKTTAKQATKALNKYLDEAYQSVASGRQTTEEAVARAVGRFAKAGVDAFDYESGRSVSIEGAVRGAIRTALNEMAGILTLEAGREAGIEKFRVTEHADSRPEHAEWQGGIYTEEELASVCGYGEVDGLKGINCRHDFYCYADDISEPPQDQEDYDPAIYEAEQQQRYIERNIRDWKRERDTLDAGNQDTSAADAKVADWQRKMREHLSDTADKTGIDLARLYPREQVAPRPPRRSR